MASMITVVFNCVSDAFVCTLPLDFIDWLGACDDQEVLRFLTERRLRPITKFRTPDMKPRKPHWERVW